MNPNRKTFNLGVSNFNNLNMGYLNNYRNTSKVINTSKNVVETTLVSTKKTKQAALKKEEVLMRKLVEFYSYSANLEQLLPVLLKKSKISLRILDWFTTNYSKEFNVSYKILHLRRVKDFCVYDSYKSQLKAYHKRLFDPFCRGHRIFFEYYEGCEIETTVAQLNFFKWAIQNKVLDYVESHLDRIISDMSIKSKEKAAEEKTNGDGIKISGEITRGKDKTIVTKIGFEQT